MKPSKTKAVRNCVIIVLLVYAGIVQMIKATTESDENCEGKWCSVFFDLIPEVLGSALTYYLIDRLIGKQETLDELLLDLGSSDNAAAINAARKLQANGWLTGKNLVGRRLIGANLSEANLVHANFQRAVMSYAKFQGAVLVGADMTRTQLDHCDLTGAYLRKAILLKADLEQANMKGAILEDANLHKSHLDHVNLAGANLTNADLSYADLFGANLENALLGSVKFNMETILPDGTKWTPTTDMNRFSDCSHPQFWSSDNRKSP